MKKWIRPDRCFLIGFGLLSWIVSISCAQSPSRRLNSGDPHFDELRAGLRLSYLSSLSLNEFSYRLEITRIPGITFRFVLPELAFLEDPGLKEEIGIVSDQKSRLETLKKLIGSFEDEIAQQLNVRNQNVSNPTVKTNDIDSEEIVSSLNKHEADFRKELESILLPHQMSLLEQLMRRHELCITGLAGYLAHPQFRKRMDVDNTEFTAMQKTIREQRVKVLEESDQFAIDTLKELVTVLDKEQVACLDSIIDRKTFESFTPEIELLIFQLQETEPSKTFDLVDETIDGFRGWIISPTKGLARSDQLVGRLNIDTLYNSIMHGPESNEFFAGKDERHVFLDRMETIRDDLFGEFDAKLEPLRIEAEKISREKGNVQAVFRKFEDEKRDFESKWWHAFELELTPEQRGALDRLLIRMVIREKGLLAAMTSGFLGKQLQIRPEQLAQLKEIAMTQSKAGMELSLKLESEVVDALVKSCDDETGQKLQILMGDRPAGLPGFPTLLLCQTNQLVLDEGTFDVLDDSVGDEKR